MKSVHICLVLYFAGFLFWRFISFAGTHVLMKPNEIKAALVLNGITATSIAKTIGLPRPNVSETISGVRKTKRIRKAIANAIGMPVEEVFPEQTKEAA